MIELYKKYNIDTLKNLIKLNNENRKGLYKMKKNDLLNIISTIKIDPENIPIIKKRYTNKNKIDQYDDENEEQKKLNDNEYYNVIDPLISKESYIDKNNKAIHYSLQEHQKRFIISYLNCNTTGCLLFHSVGSGKTLTAVVYSHYYLSIYPDHRVVIISPPSLLFNFVNTLEYYGLNKKDNRYKFETYDKFCKNPYLYIKKNKTLLIVDEAHNFRTYIKTTIKINKDDEEEKVALTNKKGFEILEVCKEYIHKILLLSGTPFINNPYDIENLISMIDKKDPLDLGPFYDLISSHTATIDYFKYRISHFDIFHTESANQFPKSNIIYVPITLNKEQEENYDKIVKNTLIDIDEEEDEYDKIANRIFKDTKKLDSFHNGPRRYLDMVGGLKVKFVIDKIKEDPKLKSIIYTTFIDSSLRLYTKALKENNIKFVIISGRESAIEKERSRLLYNNDDEYNVLLISKAGTEGVDTKNTRNVFIVEPIWNEASAEQAIARAVRFRSHISLPEKERYVDVYRLIICKNNETDLNFINKINTALKKNQLNKLHFSSILSKINEDKRQIKLSYEKEQYKEIEEIEKLGGEKYNKEWNTFINKKILELDKNRRLGLRQKHELKIEFSKDYVNKLSKENQNKFKTIMNKYQEDEEKLIDNIYKNTPSADVLLTIMSLKKHEEIYKFINRLDETVPMIEDYKRPAQEKFIKAIEENEDPKTILNIQRDILIKEKEKVLEKCIDLKNVIQENQNKVNELNNLRKTQLKNHIKYNEFFTPSNVVKKLINISKKINSHKHIDVLEPTAGSGNIVIGVLEKRKNDLLNIDMVEINPPNRDILKELVKSAPHILNLAETPNFFHWQNNKLYDLIIMNPPFHLKKSLNIEWTNKDIFDVDFVIRCYDMLKEDGEIIALVLGGTTEKRGYKEIFDKYDMYITHLPNIKWEGSKEKGKESKINNISLDILQIFKT